MNNWIAHRRVSDGEIQTVMQHLNEVSELASNFAGKLGLANVGRLIGLLHDFGKYSSHFQSYIKNATDPDGDDVSNLKGKIDHSSAGAQLLYRELSKYGPAGQGELCAQLLALSIASHHSGLIDCLSIDGEQTFFQRLQKPDETTHCSECELNADNEIKAQLQQLLSPELVKELLHKIKALIDLKHFSQNRGVLPTPEAFNLGFLLRFIFSCLIDADRLSSAEFENPERKVHRLHQASLFNWNIAIQRLEDKLASFSGGDAVNKIRAEISDTCLNRAKDPLGCYSLTVPTGGGKNLASLRFALNHAKQHGLDRIIYIIPYTSIIEQNAQAIREVLQAEGDEYAWVLEQHSNIEPENQTWHAKLTAENWDAPIVFTTMVQFLETLFGGGTRGVRKLHQLANSVLVFDEIQTLPINCTHLFCNAVNFLTQHAHSTALLCTATQPVLDRLRSPEHGQLKLCPNYELVNATQLATALRRVDLIDECKPGGWSEQEIAARVLERYQQTQSCLVIVNTKAWAQKIYHACSEQVDNAALFHLSTNQYPKHRKQLLDEIRSRLENGLPVLCISTQLIEAGVDVDFATVIRFLAGLDSIAQAAGRCNRNGMLKNANGEPSRGLVSIINPAQEPIDLLPDINQGKMSCERILSEVSVDALLLPTTISRYFDYYFFERSRDMAYPIPKLNNTLLSLLGNNQRNPGFTNEKRASQGKYPLLQQSFMTAGKAFKAIDAPTQSVIIAHGEGKQLVTQLCGIAKAFDAEHYYQTLRQAQAFSVNIFPNIWHKLLEAGAIQETQEGEGIFYLKSEFYSDEFGLTIEPCKAQDELIFC